MMEGWKHDKFKNQIQYKSGYTWSKEQELRIQEPNAVRVLTVTNVQKELDLKEELYLKDVSEKDKVDKAVSKDWCIAVSSNGNRKRIGNAVFIKDDTDYLFASFLTAFRPKPNSEIIPEFFFRWLSSHFVQERLTSVSEGTTGLGNLDIRFLRNLDIYFPDKHVQTAIANILSKVDEAIASVQNSIAAAERLKKSLMQNLLTGKMKPDGTFRTPDEFYIDEKFGKVPVGWEIQRGHDITKKITKGQSPKWQGFDYQQDGILFLTSENIQNGYIDLSVLKYLPLEFNYKIRNSQLEKGDILINIVGASIGRCAVFDIDIACANTNQAVCVFRPDNNNDSRFLSYYLQDEITQKRLIRTQVETARANLSLGDFRNFKFVIPPKEEQIKISNKIDYFSKEIESLKNKTKILERLKKSLLQNLLTGKVRVTYA